MADTDVPVPAPAPAVITTPPPSPVVVPTPADDGPDATEVKPSWMWIKDARGYGSVTVTITTIAFFVTTLAYVLSIFEKIGPIAIRPFDVSACSTYFIPILTLYFGRKYTDAKFNVNQ